VIQSRSPDWQPGQAVIVTGNELGSGQWGGWSRYIRVPSDWIVALPAELTEREAMICGTAGFTAAQCVRALQQNGVEPEAGPVVVTGATGGVGCLAVKLLSRLGYEVVASTGKADAAEWLERLGAARVISRDDTLNAADKPLATVRWAGGIDTVGGSTLSSLVRAMGVNACVAACGLVGGAELSLSVYPFILRGVILAGVTSQNCPATLRREIWSRLASDWRLNDLDAIARVVSLPDVDQPVRQILAGQIRGRVLVRVAAKV
jgi:putative YhdH/YhfP family quinone oxidoreductase